MTGTTSFQTSTANVPDVVYAKLPEILRAALILAWLKLHNLLITCHAFRIDDQCAFKGLRLLLARFGAEASSDQATAKEKAQLGDVSLETLLLVQDLGDASLFRIMIHSVEFRCACTWLSERCCRTSLVLPERRIC